MENIYFNKPYVSGLEEEYIKQVFEGGKLSGNGKFTKECQIFFEKRYQFKKCFLTSSCTDALEMAAILIRIENGDEVIIPSYTFVSTSNAFLLRGAKIVFGDSESTNPNLDASKIEALITDKTKAIVVVHYAGVACNMDMIMDLAEKYGLFVIEDAAQAIDSHFNGKPLGGIGHIGAFSFHDTKNITSGEGGMLVINDNQFKKRAEIVWEKGTNRSAFFRGEVDKYGWVDIGSSFLPSELTAACLLAQLNQLDKIQSGRKLIWESYHSNLIELEEKGLIQLPLIPDYASNNAHMFYVVCQTPSIRKKLIAFLKSNGIHPAFHYLSLHSSSFFKDKHDGRVLKFSDKYTECLLRLPLYYDLSLNDVKRICDVVVKFYN